MLAAPPGRGPGRHASLPPLEVPTRTSYQVCGSSSGSTCVQPSTGVGGGRWGIPGLPGGNPDTVIAAAWGSEFGGGKATVVKLKGTPNAPSSRPSFPRTRHHYVNPKN